MILGRPVRMDCRHARHDAADHVRDPDAVSVDVCSLTLNPPLAWRRVATERGAAQGAAASFSVMM